MAVVTDKEVTRTRATDGGVERKTVHATDETPSTSVVVARVLYWVLGVLEALLAFRFLFALLGANRANPFANFIFEVSYPFARPFFSLFGYEPVYGSSRLEMGTLVAMAIYAMVVFGIVALLRIPRGGDEV